MDNNVTPDILIVDDTPANLESLGQMLRGEGYKVRAAPNGELALVALSRSVPDLVLLDIDMPGIDGYGVCTRMKADERLTKVPVIFLSARAELDDKVRAFKVGGVDYVTKPFQFEEVRARVEAHLNLRRLQRELTELNEELEERVRVRTAQLASLNSVYERFVPHEFLNCLNKESILHVGLGDHVQQGMTVMFTDIRNFTRISESMPPQANFDFLNVYLGQISPIYRRNGGFIDKFIGDAVMALFPKSADDAVRAAIELVRGVRSLSDKLEASGQPRLRTGTGLHTGPLMLGIIGSEDRFQATVIADAVNTSSRLESLTKVYGVDILVSEDVVEKLEDFDRYCHRFLGVVRVKGREKPLQVHEIFDADRVDELERKVKTMGVFEEGLKLYYEMQFAEAAVKFDLALRAKPGDVAYKLYLKRAAQFLGGGSPQGWTGVESFGEAA